MSGQWHNEGENYGHEIRAVWCLLDVGTTLQAGASTQGVLSTPWHGVPYQNGPGWKD